MLQPYYWRIKFACPCCNHIRKAKIGVDKMVLPKELPELSCDNPAHDQKYVIKMFPIDTVYMVNMNDKIPKVPRTPSPRWMPVEQDDL